MFSRKSLKLTVASVALCGASFAAGNLVFRASQDAGLGFALLGYVFLYSLAVFWGTAYRKYGVRRFVGVVGVPLLLLISSLLQIAYIPNLLDTTMTMLFAILVIIVGCVHLVRRPARTERALFSAVSNWCGKLRTGH